MADTNATGVTFRKGSEYGLYTWDTTAPGTAVAVATPIVIQATPNSPVYYEASLQVVTASSGTSQNVGLGVTTAGTDLFVGGSGTTRFLPLLNSAARGVATDNTQFYIRESGTPDGSGVYRVIIQAAGVNLSPIN